MIEEFKMQYLNYNIDSLCCLYFDNEENIRKKQSIKCQYELEITNLNEKNIILSNLIRIRKEEKIKNDIIERMEKDEEHKKNIEARKQRRREKIQKETEERKKQEFEKDNNFVNVFQM